VFLASAESIVTTNVLGPIQLMGLLEAQPDAEEIQVEG
jgi:hypothetical protein